MIFTMKRNNKIIASSRSDVQSVLKMLNGLLRVKAGRGWLNWLLKISFSLRGGMTPAVARSAVVCLRHFYSIYKLQGVKGLVLRTKSLYILTMQAKGGKQAVSQDLGPGIALSSDGLPRIIPREHRRRIREGDVFILRLWLSWFSIYRVLDFPGKIKLNTITDPGVVFNKIIVYEMLDAVRVFCSAVLQFKVEGAAKPHLPEIKFFPLSKSTPVLKGKDRKVSSSPMGILTAAYSLKGSNVWESFKLLSEMIPSELTKPFAGDGPAGKSQFQRVLTEILAAKASLPVMPIGKLGFKSEAAGKVRVFAMVDCWTQWLLWPVHQFLFDTLRKLPTDGTHDQFAPVDRLIGLGKTKFWCYDLSAATDRLPIFTQIHLLNFLFGCPFGNAWADVLVGRDYHIPRPPKGVVAGDLPSHVRYAVGQPMGALSSWGMLALTHHFIVHWAAFRTGKPWGTFWDYAVLGDDIIIAEGLTAGAYLQLMKELGVGIGIHKSLVSRKGVLEFAKRFYVGATDCSPVPFKEVVASIVDFESCANFIQKYQMGLRSIAAFGGYGYRVRGRLTATFDKLPRKLSSLLIWRVSPWGIVPHNLPTWFNIKSAIIRPEWLVQTTEMWPSLALPFAQKFKDMALKTEERVDKFRTKGYSNDFLQTRKRVKDIFDWFDDGLWLAANKVGNWYNGLYWIQKFIWQRTIPLLSKDLTSLKDASMAIRHANFPLDESKIFKWIKLFQITSTVKDASKLGEVHRLSRSPSALWPTRLWRGEKQGKRGPRKV